jgi:hypothetical protein
MWRGWGPLTEDKKEKGPKCTCTTWTLMVHGCKCGAFKKEQEEKRKKRKSKK